MADIVGFSKMMGRDEERTVELITEFHDRVRAGIERHGGRVVGTAGDSVFGDFDSIVEAMELATEIQQDLHRRNEELPSEERLVARIGLHIGDVVMEEYNVFGDGVNIAARLEELADPGGIMVSEAVYQQVKRHSALPFEEAGTRRLKNIDQPVKLYRVAPAAFGDEPQPGPRRSDDSRGAIRDAIVSAVDEIKREVQESVREGRDGTDELPARSGPHRGGSAVGRSASSRRKGVIAAIFHPGTLSIAALGILSLLARTSGWSGNAIYPFLGSLLLGVAAGRVLAGISGRGALVKLFTAIGFGIGAGFFGAVVVKAVLWVGAAATVGSAIQDLSR
jgi:hypothetical protein